MPFDRYTLDPDGGYTFADSATGATTRAMGPAARDRAAQLDYAAQQGGSLYAPTEMPAPETVPDQLLASAPGAVVDLGEQAPIDAGAPPAGPTAAQAAQRLAAAGRATDAALAAPAAARPVMGAPPVVLDADAPDYLSQPGPGRVRQGIAVDAAGQPAPVDADGKPVVLDAERSPITINRPTAGAGRTEPSEAPFDLVPVGQSSVGASSSTTTQRSLGPDPAKWAASQRASKDAADAESEAVASRSRSQGWVADQMRDGERATNSHAEEQQRLFEEQNRIEADTSARIEAKYKEIESAKVNPSRLWENLDGYRQVGAALALGLGAVGAAMQGPGAQNQALAVLDSAIKQDIELQLRDIDKKKGESTLLQHIAQDVRDRGGSRVAQEAAMYAVHMKGVEQRIAIIAADEDSGLTKDARGMPVSRPADLLKKRAAAERARAEAVVSAEMRGTVSSSSQRTSQVTRDIHEKVERAEQDDDVSSMVLIGPDGVKRRYKLGDKLDVGEAKEYRAKAMLVNKLTNEVGLMKKLFADKNLPGWSNQYKSASNRMAANISKILDMGVLQGEERLEAQRLQSEIIGGKDVLTDIERFAENHRNDLIDQTNARQIAPAGSRASAPSRVLGRGGKEPGKHRK